MAKSRVWQRRFRGKYLEVLEKRELLSTSPSVFNNVGIGGTGTDYWATVNPNNPMDMYVESDMQVAWHTTNGGLTWTALNQTFQISANMQRNMVVYTGNTNIQYAINSGQVFKTTDDGTTWTLCSGWTFGNTGESVMADPNDPTGKRLIVMAFTRVNSGGPSNIVAISVSNGGAGYTSAPNVTIGSGGGGTGASAVANMVPDGNGHLMIGSITVTNVGSGYVNVPAITLSGGSPTTAGAAYSETDGNGSYYTYTLYYSSDGGATFTPFATSGGGTNAAMTATASGGHVTSLNITNGGSTYGTPPTILITDGGGTGAAAIATVTNGVVTGYTITNQGTGYTSTPTVTLYGGGGTMDDFKPWTAGAFFDPDETTVYYATEEGVWKGTNLNGTPSFSLDPLPIPVLPVNDPGSGGGVAGDPAGYSSFTASNQNGTTRLAAVTWDLQQFIDADPGVQITPNTTSYSGIYTQQVGTDAGWVDMDPGHKFGPTAQANGQDPLYLRGVQMVTGTSHANGDINNIVFSGGDNLGSGKVIPIIYKATTTDGGATWTWTSLFQTGLDSYVTGEAVNQNIYQRSYMQKGDMGVDSAATFLMDPLNANIMTMTNQGTLYETADGGNSWYDILAGGPFTPSQGSTTGAFVQPTVANLDPFYYNTTTKEWANVGAYDPIANPYGQQKNEYFASSSLEETATWKLAFPDPNDIVAAVTDVTAEHSTDGGLTWQFPATSAPPVAANTYYDIAYDPTHNILYAVTSDVHNLYITSDDGHVDDLGKNHVVMSTDDGATWTSATGSYSGSNGPNVGLPLGAPARAIALDPMNPNVAYIGTANANEYPYVSPSNNPSGGGLWMTTDLLDGSNTKWIYLGGGYGATASVTTSGGVVTGFTGLVGGSGYDTSADTVAIITGGGGHGATASVTVTGGIVTGITVTNGGAGYTGTPSVTIVSQKPGAQPTRDLNADGNQEFSAEHPNQLFVVHDDQWASDGNTDPNHEMVVAVFALREPNGGGVSYTAGVWVSLNDGQSWIDRSSVDGNGDDEVPGQAAWDGNNLITSQAYSLTIDPNIDATTSGHDWYLTTYDGSGVALTGNIYKSTDEGKHWSVWSNFGQAYTLWIEPGGTRALLGAKSNKQSSLVYIPNYQAANPQFITVQSYPFSAITNIQQDPFHPDEIWFSTFGSGIWNASLTALSTPQAVQNVVAQTLTSTEVQVSWTVEGPVGTSYAIQYSTSANFSTFNTVTDPNYQDSSYIVGGLTAGTVYYFRVVTQNSVGSSNPSNVASTRTDSAAGTIAYDGFAYNTGNLSGDNGGTGWATAWNAGTNSTIVTSATHTFSLPNTPPDTTGNLVQVKATPATDPSRTLTSTIGTSGTVLWVSFMAETISGSGIIFGDSTTGFGFGNGTGQGGFNFLTFYTISGGTYTYYNTTTKLTFNFDHLYVARLDFESDGIHVNLWTDPAAGKLYPGTTATWQSNYTGVFPDPLSSGTASVALHHAGTSFYDEIRLGHTYADVAPLAGLAAPAQPTSITVTPASPNANGVDGNPNEIDISWANGSQTNPQQGELIQESTDGGATWSTIEKTIDPGATITNYAVTNLNPNTSYKFQVAAYNAAGTSAYRTSSSVTTISFAPNAPTGLTATTDGAGNYSVSWTAPSGGTAPIGYYLQYTDDQNSGYDENLLTWNSTSLIAGTSTTLNLTPNKLYYFRVFAINNGGLSPVSNILASAPGNPTATGSGAAQVTLQWNDLFGDETGYTIQQSTNGTSGWTTVGTAPASAGSYTVTGLSANTQYFFRVAVVGNGYNGAWSAPIAGRTLSADPLVYEGFDYSITPASSTDLGGASGGIGFSGSWTGVSGTYQISSASLVGTNSAVANNLLTTGYAFNSQANGNITRPLATPLGGSAGGGTYWASILVQENEATPSGLIMLQGSDGISNIEFGFSSSLFGIIVTNGHGTWTGGTTPAAGSTHLLVIRIDYGTTNTFNLWLDPDPSAGTPTSATAIVANKTTTFQLPTFNSIKIQGSTSGATNDFWDELRIGNTFASVAPEKVPAAPSSLTATGNGAKISLTWTDNASNPQETGFYLQRSTDLTNWSTIFSAAQNATSYADTLAVGGTYYYRVDAYNTTNNITNESIYSNIASAVAVTSSLNAPSSITATPNSSAMNVALNWSSVSGATSYSLQRSSDNGAHWNSVATGIGITTYTDSTVSSDTTYIYQVNATGSGTSPWSTSSNNTLTIPATPAAFIAQPGAGYVALSFNTDPADVTSYTLQRSTDNSTFTNLVTISGTAYHDTATTAGVLYYYRVDASNATGNSPFTTSASSRNAIPGDINLDGHVDLTDLTILASNWQKHGTWTQGDLNGDGNIDLTDLTILASNWQTSASAAALAPVAPTITPALSANSATTTISQSATPPQSIAATTVPTPLVQVQPSSAFLKPTVQPSHQFRSYSRPTAHNPLILSTEFQRNSTDI